MAAVMAKEALAELKSDKPLTELAEQNEDRVDQITQSKSQLQERARDVFTTAAERSESTGPDVKEQHVKIGRLAMENDFMSTALGRVGEASARSERKTMIDRSDKRPVLRQSNLQGLSPCIGLLCASAGLSK